MSTLVDRRKKAKEAAQRIRAMRKHVRLGKVSLRRLIQEGRRY